jgi:hypothetical protein
MTKGRIAFKGRKRRPWLEIRRPELDRTYLDHQLRRLRAFHDGPVEAVYDTVPGDGFYDEHRIRFHGEGLYRVYELLYPRDQRLISRAVLDIAGDFGLASLWVDGGESHRQWLDFTPNYSAPEYEATVAWMRDLGFEARLNRSDSTLYGIRVHAPYDRKLRKHLNRIVHPSKRAGLLKHPAKL